MIEGYRSSVLLRWLVSLGLLSALTWWLKPSILLQQVVSLAPAWLAAALLVTVVQTLISAWRWRFTARCLGLDLSRRQALGDYYLACFVNQVLPGGVAGDALRAHRHARGSGAPGPAWYSVVLERASGQMVVVATTLAVVGCSTTWRQSMSDSWPEGSVFWLVTATAVFGVGGLSLLAARRWPAQWRGLRENASRALLSRSAWPRQLGASILVVFSYALVFAMAGRGIGLDIDFLRLMAVALPVLLAMLIPFSVGGWGFREAAASGVWLALGWPPAEGVALALAYGLITLLASLPGALVLAWRPRVSARA